MTEVNICVISKNPLNQRTQVRLNRGFFSCLDLHLCHRPGILSTLSTTWSLRLISGGSECLIKLLFTADPCSVGLVCQASAYQ